MYKCTVDYLDFDGNERHEDCYFNMTKAEAFKFENTAKGGVTNVLKEIVMTDDNVKLIELFERFVKMSYGKKSSDGRKFVKSDEIFEEFAQTEAYSVIFMHLISDSKFAADFVNGVLSTINGKPNVTTNISYKDFDNLNTNN